MNPIMTLNGVNQCDCGTYFIDVQVVAESVELRVERLQEADDVHGRGSGANGCEPDQIAEQHRHIVVVLSLDRLTCSSCTTHHLISCGSVKVKNRPAHPARPGPAPPSNSVSGSRLALRR